MSKETSPINHLLFMDHLKLSGRSERELKSLVRTVHIIFTETGMKFSMDRCKILLICRGKIIDIDDIEMPDEKRMKQVEGCKYLGVIQDSLPKSVVLKTEMEEHFRRIQKL